MIGYVYKMTHPNGKIYVGSHVSPFIDEKYYGRGSAWLKAIKGLPKSSLMREILEECDTYEQLKEQEKYWILKLDAKNPKIGYNRLVAGNNGSNDYHWWTNGINTVFSKECPYGYVAGVDEQTRISRSEALKGIPKTEEAKKKYSDTKLGDLNPMKQLIGENHPKYGKKCYSSPDKSKSGYFIPGEEPNGWILGMKYSSPNRKGKNNPAYGRHWYNNGKEQVYTFECPKGFVPGQLKKT